MKQVHKDSEDIWHAFAEIFREQFATAPWANATSFQPLLDGLLRGQTEAWVKIWEPVFSTIENDDKGHTVLSDLRELMGYGLVGEESELEILRKHVETVFSAGLRSGWSGGQFLSLLMKSWADAAADFATVLETRQREGKAPETLQAALGLWTEVAEHRLHRTLRSDDYTAVQADLLRAVMEQRLAGRAIVEKVSQALDLPTRSELDEAYQSMAEMRRELRGLRGRLRALEHDRSKQNAEPAMELSNA